MVGGEGTCLSKIFLWNQKKAYDTDSRLDGGGRGGLMKQAWTCQLWRRQNVCDYGLRGLRARSGWEQSSQMHLRQWRNYLGGNQSRNKSIIPRDWLKTFLL